MCASKQCHEAGMPKRSGWVYVVEGGMLKVASLYVGCSMIYSAFLVVI